MSSVLILLEHVMLSHFSQQVAAVQLAPSQLSVSLSAEEPPLALRTHIHIKGVCVTAVTAHTPATRTHGHTGVGYTHPRCITPCMFHPRQGSK